MRRLSPVEAGELEVLEAVIEAKRGARRGRLRHLLPTLKERYAEYAENTSRLARLTPSTLGRIRHNDCIHCYSRSTAPLGQLRRTVIDALPLGRDFYCQYCLLSEWDALDHYVPKEQFPEFSILSRNLVPCCGKCNRLKGDDWPARGDPRILNLYYDDFPDEQYLVATIDMAADGIPTISFTLRRPARVTLSKFRRLQSHFERLELLQRYIDASVTAVGEYRRTLAAHGFRTGAEVAAHLQEEAEGLEDHHGRNYWKAVLTSGLTAAPGFLALVAP
jgi:5-methylcytosine-specific restriction endonuclease McrA